MRQRDMADDDNLRAFVHALVDAAFGAVERDDALAARLRANLADANLLDALRVRDLVAPRRRGSGRPPEGMTVWISTPDVQAAIGCSRSKAYECLRAAAGRRAGDPGGMLRVPLDLWEAWAFENLAPKPSPLRGPVPRPPSPPGGGGVRVPEGRHLGPFPAVKSEMPLIPLQKERIAKRRPKG